MLLIFGRIVAIVYYDMKMQPVFIVSLIYPETSPICPHTLSRQENIDPSIMMTMMTTALWAAANRTICPLTGAQVCVRARTRIRRSCKQASARYVRQATRLLALN